MRCAVAILLSLLRSVGTNFYLASASLGIYFTLRKFVIEGSQQINLGTFGVLSNNLSAPGHFGSLSMFSINQSLFPQRNKPLYPNLKYLFGIGIWIWASKNQGFSHRVSVVHGCTHNYNGIERDTLCCSYIMHSIYFRDGKTNLVEYWIVFIQEIVHTTYS